jgi:exosortase
VLAAGLAVYLVGQLGADVFLTRISLVAVAAGALWFACGTAVMRLAAAPLVFLLIAIPPPTLVVNAATLPLQLTASQIAEQTLTVAGVSVFRDGNVLELPSGSLEVAEACSGLRSAVSLAAIAVLLAWTQPTWPRRAAMIAASVPIAIVMNGLRIAATALASEAWGPETATGGWHTFTGWVTFVASLAVLMALQRAVTPRRSARPKPVGAMVGA